MYQRGSHWIFPENLILATFMKVSPATPNQVPEKNMGQFT
jgi:hypothetical protein